jgi:glycosyltransferase involved in cell wall biosynthesis
MHIGLITSDLSNKNGWATYSLNLIQALRAQGIKTTIVTSHNCPDVEFEVHRLLPSVTPPERHTFAKSMLQTLKLHRLMTDCDIIHSTIEPFAILADRVAGNRPLFITAHGSYVNLHRMRRFPINKLYERAFRHAELICVSHYTAQIARKNDPTIKAHVINNGVDTSRFINPPPIPQPKTAPTVITSGGIKPRKGTLQLVEAMAIVRERIPDVQCLVMGNPQLNTPYNKQVQDTIQRLDLSETVHLMGFVDDDLMRAWFAEADVLALPSINDGLWFEGFGLVVFEASSAGTAVIGTDECGVADAIDHNKTGLIVSQANVADELPQAIINLLSNLDKAQRMGEAGRIKAQAQTWDVVGQQVIERYKHALML